MIIKNYKLLTDEKDDKLSESRDIIKNLKDIFLEKYFNNNTEEFKDAKLALINQLPFILASIGSVEDKVIVDLGCGSNNEYDNVTNHRMFEPWLCRALYELKVDPIGVDLDGLENEEFRDYKRNLLKESLDFIPDSSVDLVNAHELFNSPTFSNLKYNGSFQKNKLVLEVKRILKPEGHFIYSN